MSQKGRRVSREDTNWHPDEASPYRPESLLNALPSEVGLVGDFAPWAWHGC